MAHWDQIDVGGSPMRLYVGMPSLGRAFPAVIVIQHGPGVDRFIQDRVETLSEQHGYLAIAPDLYHRQPEDGDMMTRIGRLRDPEVVNEFARKVGEMLDELLPDREANDTVFRLAWSVLQNLPPGNIWNYRLPGQWKKKRKAWPSCSQSRIRNPPTTNTGCQFRDARKYRKPAW